MMTISKKDDTKSKRIISPKEVAKHNTAESCWIIIEGKVYDVTKFAEVHPGGKRILLREGGKDATKVFHKFHRPIVLKMQAAKLLIGTVGEPVELAKTELQSANSKKDEKNEQNDKENEKINKNGENSAKIDQKSTKNNKNSENSKNYKLVKNLPFTEPYWFKSNYKSPYYTESHLKWQQTVRDFVEENLMADINQWEKDYKLPLDIYKKAGDLKILAGVIAHHWPSEFMGESPAENYDAFHTHILIDEISRTGSGGVIWGLITGLLIGVPPIYNFGSEFLKQKVIKDCLTGRKIICLCISEPQTASDVAGICTTAEKNGENYIVNGSKKWITNGTFADYFTVAVRTGGKGHKALSLLLIEKTMPGVSVRHMKCQGVHSSGTAYILFENVKVPLKNLIGNEGDGFKYIMHNFNHERWGIIIMANRLARVAFSDALKYSLERKTFGKRLIDHQAIRFKLSNMARQIESVHAWTEVITYQWKQLTEMERNEPNRAKEIFENCMRDLGDKIALLKVQSTKTLEKVARESLHIFGGSGYVQSGKGERVERIYRETQAFSVPAGAEEIMLDYAARMMDKKSRA